MITRRSPHRFAVSVLVLTGLASASSAVTPAGATTRRDGAPQSVAAAGVSGSTEVGGVREPASATQSTEEAKSENGVSKASLASKGLQGLKSSGAEAIARRQRTLTELAAKLAGQTNDCGANATVASQVASTSASLAAVGSTLSVSTDVAVARDLVRSIYEDHRVYALVAPKVAKVIRCDAQLQRNEKLAGDATTLQAAIDAAKAKGTDTSAAQSMKDAAVARLAAITPANAIAGIIGLVPDRGDAAVAAANRSALDAADAHLDATFAEQKAVHNGLADARKLLSGAAKERKNDGEGTKKAARQAASGDEQGDRGNDAAGPSGRPQRRSARR